MSEVQENRVVTYVKTFMSQYGIGIAARKKGILPTFEVTEDSDFVLDLGFDEKDSLAFILAVEDDFHIQLSDETDFVTVGELTKYIEDHSFSTAASLGTHGEISDRKNFRAAPPAYPMVSRARHTRHAGLPLSRKSSDLG
jgi:acyl carrier protein